MHLLLFTYGQKPNINTRFLALFSCQGQKNFFKHSNKLISHLNKLGFVLAIFPLTYHVSQYPRSCSNEPQLEHTEVKYSISRGTFTLTSL